MSKIDYGSVGIGLEVLKETHTLREWRTIRAVGVRELARRAGLSSAAIVALEHRRSRGYPRTWRRIAEALGIEPLQIAEYRQSMGVDRESEGS